MLLSFWRTWKGYRAVAFWPRNDKTAVRMSPVADKTETKRWLLCEYQVRRLKEASSAETCVGWKALSRASGSECQAAIPRRAEYSRGEGSW